MSADRDLIAKLETGATLVTPNRRLAQHLQANFDRAQRAAGRMAWRSPDILPLSAFVARCYDDASHTAHAGALPPVLSNAQEIVLWETAIRRSDSAAGLLSPAQTAAQCRDAWATAHAWRILERMRGIALHEDASAFLDWAGRYDSECRRHGHSDAARLSDDVAALVARHTFTVPHTLIAYGFDIVTPQEDDLLKSFAAADVEVVRIPAATATREIAAARRRIAFASVDDEIAACARWARARLENDPAARIGVVALEVAQDRARIARAFANVFALAQTLSGAAALDPAFDISLGAPLSAEPCVHDALCMLELAGGDGLEFDAASNLLRSPFIAGAETEMGARAQLDLRLREHAATRVSLEKLARAANAAGCAILAARLGQALEQARTLRATTRSAAQWSETFGALLNAFGFPGERTLDSREFQALEKFRAALGTLVTIDGVAPRLGFSAAVTQLARIAADTLFHVESRDAPVAILGVLESAGLAFDHLWVMGLSDAAWPMPARANPLLPIALLRAAGVPESSPQHSLALDRRIGEGWSRAAREVVFSHALRVGDEDFAASRLIADIPECAADSLGLPAFTAYRDVLHASRRVEVIEDQRAPPYASNAASGAGAALFRDQAACPFRAYARHRLAAQSPALPGTGLGPAERGILLHTILAGTWTEIRTHARLVSTSESALTALLEREAARAVETLRKRGADALQGRFAALETERLVRLVRTWLEYEKTRTDFEVVACEEKREAEAGGVRVRVRLDRMDRLGGENRYAIIDYKTGGASASGMLGERPDEPQLPLYLVAAGEDAGKIAALAFAKVALGDTMAFDGIGSDDDLIPGVVSVATSRSAKAREYASWSDLVAHWRTELDNLGRGFAEGDARVNPKHGAQTCRQCDLHALCRVNEIDAGRALDSTPISVMP